MASEDNRVRVDWDEFGNGPDGDHVTAHSNTDPCGDAPLSTESELIPLASADEKAVIDLCSCAPRLQGPETTSNNPREWSA